MKYTEAVHFLDNLTRFGIKLGLEPIRGLLSELGNPQEGYKSIHITGTNGKGSVANFIANILSEAGYKVGLYTSPHLLEVTERIALPGKPISKRRFADLMTELLPKIEKRVEASGIPLTYFEVVTAAAFQYFAAEKIDLLVAEVGMGGRLDATNILQPLVCVITPISLEHTEYLGGTLAAIAWEKCGIIKKGSIVVSSPQRREVAQVIREECKKKDVALYWASRGRIHPTRGLDESSPYMRKFLYNELKLPALGEFQIENAAVAAKAIKALSSFSFRIKNQDIRRGLLKTKIFGRLQVLSKKPLIIYDVGHNPAAVKALCKSLINLFSHRKYIFIYGCLEGKDSESILKIIAPIAKLVILTKPKSKRAKEVKDLFRIAKEYLKKEKIKMIANPKAALRFALEHRKKEPICIFGSFYLAGSLENLLCS